MAEIVLREPVFALNDESVKHSGALAAALEP